MELHYTPAILPLLAAAIISLFVATYVWPRRQTRGANFLALMALTITPWALGYALEIAGTHLATKIFWGKSQYIGIVFAPYFWLRFALAYTQQDRPRATRLLNRLAILPFVTLTLALTTEWHGLIWTEMTILETGFISVLGVTHGLWFWIHFVSSYLMLAAGTVLILRALRHKQELYRAQVMALLVAILSPWVGNILYFAGLSPVPGLDLTPFAFTISVVALAWGIFGYRLGDILPIARDLVIEAMRDGMIVLDGRGRVADMNNSAGRIIGVPASQAIGQPISELFQPWPHILDHLRHEGEIRDAITIGEGSARRQYEINISTIDNAQNTTLGRVITLHDASPASTPSPRFTPHPLRHQPPLPSEPPQAVAPTTHPAFSILVDFFLAPVKTNLPVPPDVNPGWMQTLERAFTIILRIAAVLGTLTLLFTWSYLKNVPAVLLAFSFIMSLVWVLGLVRDIPFRYRTALFLLLIYLLAVIETVNFGYSAESFTFFFTFVMLAVLLTELRGGVIALSIALTTIGFLGWQIGAGVYVPGAARNAPPESVVAAASSLLAFTASTLGAIAATSILLRSLNRAWQRETQALNLLGQERDLLEQRIAERTQDLAEARDEAVKSSLELQRYFLALEQSGNSIFITDPEGNIEYVNPKFEELTGYTMAEARGNNPRLLKSGEQSYAFYEHLWKTISAGEIWRGEMHNRRKDGSLYWQSATIAPVLNQAGQVTHYVAINEDITAQKQLQEQLKRQNEYLSILHQTTLDLLNRQSLDELLPTIVERACVLLDAPFGEIMLKEGEYMVVRAFTRNQPYLVGDRVDRQTAKLSWQAHDTGRPVVLDNYSHWKGHRAIYDPNPLQAVADFPVMVGETCIGVLALGRIRPDYPFSPEQVEMGVLFARLAALVLDNANLYDSALKEIEERKRAEESLAIARDQALQASRFKSQLLAKVSHEFRTPLGAILGYTELLWDETFGPLSPKQKQIANEVMDSTEYLTSLVGELLDEAHR